MRYVRDSTSVFENAKWCQSDLADTDLPLLQVTQALRR